MKKDFISIILPVYNEGDNITRVITELEKTVKPEHEILIVYDFDEDNTIPPAKKLQKKYKSVRLVKNTIGRGVLNAAKMGIRKSLGDTVVIMPADLADDPRTINRMYEKIKEGYDIVCATRYTKGGKKLGGGLLKKMFSQMAGLATPLVLGIPTTDISNGFKMYRKKVLDSIKIESDGGWEFAMEIVIKAHHSGFKIGETPSIWRDRLHGTSNFKFKKWLPKYLRWYASGIKRRFLS